MTDLRHRVRINAAPEKVYAAVATQAGMQGWWTRDTTLNAKVGGKAEFGFDRRAATFHMTIEELTPNGCVRMTCAGDHPEWAGTTLEWRVEPMSGGSLLAFEHRGWREPTEFCTDCNSMWGNLMYRLKSFVESGQPAPQWPE
jgi:uncharacterized protein YndB with AHSA1/START domain